MNCPREAEVWRAIEARHWPERCDDELRAHAASCVDCADLVEVATVLTEECEDAMHAAQLPPSGAVWYRAHGDGDTRNLAMTPEHILRLLGRYRAALPPALGDEDRRLFYDFGGYWLFTLYHMTAPSERSSLREFVLRAWRDGLYNPRWSRGYGRKRLVGLMLTGR